MVERVEHPDIENQKLARFYAYWFGKLSGRSMPARADLDPIEMPEFLPGIILFDVEPGTDRLKARLVGTAVVTHYGMDYTGQYLTVTVPGASGTPIYF